MTALNDLNALQASIAEAVLGQDQVIRQMIVGLLANGHLLLESLPGLAKTRAVKSMAKNLDTDMRRIQFTPDLLPSDITGTEVLHQQGGQNIFQFQPGPIFGNVILADEINRAPAKVQAALLEAMEERQITVAGTTHTMPELFIVMATQNPIEQEGTYPLPEAQLDRFLMKVLVDYPDKDSEIQVLELVRSEEVGRFCARPQPRRSRASSQPACSRRAARSTRCTWRLRSSNTSWRWSTPRAIRPTTTRRWPAGSRSVPARVAALRWSAPRASTRGWMGATTSRPTTCGRWRTQCFAIASCFPTTPAPKAFMPIR